MTKMHLITLVAIAILGFASFGQAWAEVNSGSDGSDGAFNPTTNIVIDMADHPNGIYQYTDVNIPVGVTVTFIPNANNTPVMWLVQGNVVINGSVDVSGQSGGQFTDNGIPGLGGPGGFSGGDGGVNGNGGKGPGGGSVGPYGEPAAFGALPTQYNGTSYVPYPNGSSIYGNNYLLPLIGGSGGGGGTSLPGGGGGGGGAILIAASQSIQINGSITANGGQSAINHYYYSYCYTSGGGSGGAIRLVATSLAGSGYISAAGGADSHRVGGQGRIRFDVLGNNFGGQIVGVFTQGFQPIIIPVAGQGVQLSIASVAGASVSANPSGQIVSPDTIISGQQANPIPIVVNCSNLPLNTLITVIVKPASGSSVSAVGYNNTGTLASSTATVLLNMPRGGGIIYATAASGN